MRMTHMLQVRNVSAETLTALKQRARAAGMSLSDYARKELERVVATPTAEELFDRVKAHRTRLSVQDIVADIAQARERR